MRSDFGAFILTHGRAGRVQTKASLRAAGYTGPIYYIVDDEDDQLADYQAEDGVDEVIVFSKSEIEGSFDPGTNSGNRASVVYARNVVFQTAERLGLKYFVELDDDYTYFNHRFRSDRSYYANKCRSLDDVLTAYVAYLEETPQLTCIAFAQGGDFMGGGESSNVSAIRSWRKVMNSFICSTDRPFQFYGILNDDVNTYLCLQHRGEALFMTPSIFSLTQRQTQQNEGGLTDLYLESGTYVKSFYSVMYTPSCVTVTDMGSTNRRLHHRVKWNNAAPMIISESHRKVEDGTTV